MTITRNSERGRRTRRTTILTIVVSVVAHILVAVLVLPHMLEDEVPAPPDDVLEVTAQYEEPEEPEEPEVPDEPEVASVATPEPVEEKLSAEVLDNAQRQEPEPPAPEPLPPPPAPSESTSEPTSEPTTETAAESNSAEPEPSPPDETSPLILPKKPDARALLMPSIASYDKMLAQRDDSLRERAKEAGKGDRLFANYEKNAEGLKESLTSFGHSVNPGNHTGVDPKSTAYGTYVGMIHDKIHVRWAHGYLEELDLREPAGSPLNNPELNTTLEFVIRASDGEVEKVNIVRSSGQLRFDAQAATMARMIGPHRGAPEELVSPDGRVYIHWNFWRDQRQCGLFGVSVFIVNG